MRYTAGTIFQELNPWSGFCQETPLNKQQLRRIAETVGYSGP